jgi:hypothetical protein
LDNKGRIKMKNKTIYLSIGILLMGILLMGNVLAFAVSSQYWEENPLRIGSGETQKSFIVLQNMAGSETINARVTVLEGSEIVTLDNPDKIYEIPVGQTVNVDYTVIIPSTSVTGQATSPISTGGTYNLIFDVTTVNPQGAGTFSFGSGMQKVIPVLITIPIIEKEVAPWLYYLIVGLLVVIIIVVVILIVRKRKKK